MIYFRQSSLSFVMRFISVSNLFMYNLSFMFGMFTFTLETAPLIPDINSSLATLTSHNDGTYPSTDKTLAILIDFGNF